MSQPSEEMIQDTNEINSADSILKIIHTSLINLQSLNEFVFFNLYKDIICKVYKYTNSYKDNNLYAVILKEDIIETRGMINYFIFLYNISELRKKFPLIIQYIPKESENELINVKKISFSND